MTLVILLVWAAIVILFLMGVSKYRYTRPPLVWMLLFFLAGVVSVIPAALYNGWINLNTRFSFFSPNLSENAVAFIVGPGLGEEFCKFGLGLVVMLAAVALRAPLTPASRIQGFVLVALGFAIVENISYLGMGMDNIVVRGFLPVPMHAAMGFIHGTAVNAVLKHGRGIYLFIGYFICVLIHAGYNTVVSNLPIAYGAAVIVLLVGVCTVIWLRAPEENEAIGRHEDYDPWLASEPSDDY